MSRECAHCRKPLVQRPSEDDRKFATRQTCNFECGAHLGHTRMIERTLRVHGITVDELDRRRAAGLCACGKPVSIGKRGTARVTCGDHRCRGMASGGGRKQADDDSYSPGWPQVTGPVEADFWAHNIATTDGGYGFKIVRADDRSYAGCSAAYTAGMA